MSVLHLRSVPGSVWPAVPGGEVSQLWALYLQLEQSQWFEPAELLEGQLAQVRGLLEHCRANVPYYQHALRQAGVEPKAIRTLADFRRLSTLSRRTVQDQFVDLQARELPAGTKPTTVMRTSGTSGMPIEVRQTNLVNLWWFAFHLRDVAWCGLDPQGSLAAIRGLGAKGTDHERAMAGVRQPYWNEQFARLLKTGPAFVMDIHQEPRRQLDWLLQVRPDYLLSYPPNLQCLADLLAQDGRRLEELKVILSIGETLTGEGRAQIEGAFGVPVKNGYSCVEAGYLASACPEGHGLHVHSENVLLEVLNEDGQPCTPGETGRIVLTTLHNLQMPFVRYEILDAATLGPERCPCGRGLPLLTQVHGKRRPQFHLPDGRRKDSGFLVRRLRQFGGYRQHQIIQPAVDHLVVRLVAGPEWNETLSAQVVREVREYFENPVRVDVELVERMELTQAGKVRDVIVDLD